MLKLALIGFLHEGIQSKLNTRIVANSRRLKSLALVDASGGLKCIFEGIPSQTNQAVLAKMALLAKN
jgi:hypothetical protein